MAGKPKQQNHLATQSEIPVFLNACMDTSPSPEGAPLTAATQPSLDDRVWQRMARHWVQVPEAPWLVGEVAGRLADRLSVLRQPPQRVAVWDAEARWTLPVLQSHLPQAQLSAVRPKPVSSMTVETNSPAARSGPGLWQRASGAVQAFGRSLGRGHSSPLRGPKRPQPPAVNWVDGPSAWSTQPVDLVWSHLQLHRQADVASLMRAWRGALGEGGLLLFSTWGPDTVRQLSTLWSAADWGPASQPWVDMHDWGDAVVEAGFDDPVMDQERLTLTWADVPAALAELRSLGRNAHPGRFAGCRGRRWFAQMSAILEAQRRPDGRIALDFEVIYGHAVRGRDRMPLAPETRISVEAMRQSLRNRHR